jgi:hypothetical protein
MQQGREPVAQSAQAIHLMAEQCRVIHRLKHAGPEHRGILHDAEVSLLGERVDHAIRRFEEIEHLDFDVVGRDLDGFTQAAGGGIVAVTEPGRKNKNSLHGSPFLRPTCASRVTDRCQRGEMLFTSGRVHGDVTSVPPRSNDATLEGRLVGLK